MSLLVEPSRVNDDLALSINEKEHSSLIFYVITMVVANIKVHKIALGEVTYALISSSDLIMITLKTELSFI